jgi:hypothetical protein
MLETMLHLGEDKNKWAVSLVLSAYFTSFANEARSLFQPHLFISAWAYQHFAFISVYV